MQFSRSVVSDSLRPRGLQNAKFPCPSPTPRTYSNSCLSSRWCHPTISCSVIPFSCLQSFPASGSFSMSQFFASGGQNIGASASAPVLPMNIQGWFPLGLAGLMSLQSKGPSRLFSSTIWKHQANQDPTFINILCSLSFKIPTSPLSSFFTSLASSFSLTDSQGQLQGYVTSALTKGPKVTTFKVLRCFEQWASVSHFVLGSINYEAIPVS